MLAPFPWLWLLGAGIALVVGVIAFIVAAGLAERPASGAAAGTTGEHAANGVRRAS